MKKVAEGLWRQITTRKTKSGVKTYTYYYTKGTGKRRFERMPVTAAKKRATLTEPEVETVLSNIEDKVTRQAVRNEIKYRQKKGQNIDLSTIESLLEDDKLDKQQQFIRNLGYSEEEFEEQFGLTASDLRKGKFENQDGLIKFTSIQGEKRYFIWDYERGLIEK